MGPLEEQPVLTTEASLQLLCCCLKQSLSAYSHFTCLSLPSTWINAVYYYAGLSWFLWTVVILVPSAQTQKVDCSVRISPSPTNARSATTCRALTVTPLLLTTSQHQKTLDPPHIFCSSQSTPDAHTTLSLPPNTHHNIIKQAGTELRTKTLRKASMDFLR